MNKIVEKIINNWNEAITLVNQGVDISTAKDEVLSKRGYKFKDTDNVCFGVKYKFNKSTCHMDCPLRLDSCDYLSIEEIVDILNRNREK